MSKIPAADRYRLYERLIGGAGPDRTVDDFATPDAAFAELNRLMTAHPNLYCGPSPSHRVLVKDRTATS